MATIELHPEGVIEIMNISSIWDFEQFIVTVNRTTFENQTRADLPIREGNLEPGMVYEVKIILKTETHDDDCGVTLPSSLDLSTSEIFCTCKQNYWISKTPTC